MGDIPVKTEDGKVVFLKDVATPKDASFIQTNVVRVNGRRAGLHPGLPPAWAPARSSVVNELQEDRPGHEEQADARRHRPQGGHGPVGLRRNSIESLAEEGVLGAVLCSLVILIFLGEWRMTLIAVMTIPVAVLAAIIGLYYTGNTINVMTLAGLSLAIGPLVDSAIICLENTHRHLGLGAKPKEAAFLGASEVAMPELVASCCTLLVLAPLALMPGMGTFLFRPMALAVAFAMIVGLPAVAVVRARRCAACGCKSHGRKPRAAPRQGLRAPQRARKRPSRRACSAGCSRAWEALINRGIAGLRPPAQAWSCGAAGSSSAAAVVLLVAVVVGARLAAAPRVLPGGRRRRLRDLRPRRDRHAHRGDREADRRGREVRQGQARRRPGADHQRDRRRRRLVGRLHAQRRADGRGRQGPAEARTARIPPRSTCSAPRQASPTTRRFADLEFAFDAGGMIRGAMNEGKSTPINVRITAKDLRQGPRRSPRPSRHEVKQIDGVVDCRIMQRLDYPEYIIDVDQAKAADLGLTQTDVMKNVVAALNSSIQFNKKNFWIDPVSHNQYYVGVQYPEEDITVARHAAGHADHQPGAEEADPAAQHGHGAARQRAGRGHAHQPAADDRPDDGRPRPRPGPRRRRRGRGRRRQFGELARAAASWTPYDPTDAASTSCWRAARSRSAASTRACRTPSATWASA